MDDHQIKKNDGVARASTLQHPRDGFSVLEAAQAALLVAPESPPLHAWVGALAAQTGDYGRAVQHLERALQLDPGLDDVRLQLGVLFATLDRIEAAELHLEHLARAGDFVCTAYANALLACFKGNWTGADAWLDRAIARDEGNVPRQADMRQLRGRVRHVLRSTAAAESTDPVRVLELYDPMDKAAT